LGAQQWDWIQYTKNIDNYSTDLSYSENDSEGNIYNCFNYFGEYIKENSKKFKDTIKTSNLNFDINQKKLNGKLTKFNKSGKMLWQSNYFGEHIEMAFYNENCYLLCKFKFNDKISINFGISNLEIDLTDNNKEKNELYYIFKFDKKGKQIACYYLLEFKHKDNNSSNYLEDFIMKDEDNILFSIRPYFDFRNSNFVDSIVFKNNKIFFGSNKLKYPSKEFLISASLNNNLNWFKSINYEYTSRLGGNQNKPGNDKKIQLSKDNIIYTFR
jgi:hypothetical protein